MIIVKEIILNVIIAYSPLACSEVTQAMLNDLQYEPLDRERIFLDATTQRPCCMIRYLSTIHIEGFKGV